MQNLSLERSIGIENYHLTLCMDSGSFPTVFSPRDIYRYGQGGVRPANEVIITSGCILFEDYFASQRVFCGVGDMTGMAGQSGGVYFYLDGWVVVNIFDPI